MQSQSSVGSDRVGCISDCKWQIEPILLCSSRDWLACKGFSQASNPLFSRLPFTILLVGSTLIVLIPQQLNDRAKMVAKLLHKITEVIRIISRRAWVLHRQGLPSSYFSTEARSLCSGCHEALRFMQSAERFALLQQVNQLSRAVCASSV